MANELTKSERATLESLEEQIKRSMSGFVEAGGALLRIRDERLYRNEHETFEAYCRDRWLIGKAYAHRLIESAKVVNDLTPELSLSTENVSPIGDKVSTDSESSQSPILPANEAQARELAKAPPEKRAEIWMAAVEASPKDEVTGKPRVTAAAIREQVHRVAPSAPSASESNAAPTESGSVPENLATDAQEIDELEAATRDAPATNDPRQPWLAYNATVSRILDLFSEIEETITSLVNAPGEEAAFAEWITLKDWRKMCRNSVANFSNHRVANWASQRQAAKNGRRNFLYVHEVTKKGRGKGAA